LVVMGTKILRPFEILSTEQVDKIDRAAMTVLMRVGVKMQHDGILKILDDAGAEVDYGQKVAKIPEQLVREVLRKAPRSYIAYGRDPEKACFIGEDYVHMRGGGTHHMIVDPISKTTRPATMKDLEDGTRLLDGLENVHLMGNPGSGHWTVPQDVPVPIRDLYEWKALFENSGKPGAGHTYSRANARYIIKMAETIAGSAEELRSKPMLSYECEGTSPLVYSTNSLEIMEEYASRGLPISFNPMPLTGATSPVTFAGTLALHVAEILAGIVVAQLINSGTPVAYGCFACAFDMKTCVQSYGSANAGLLRAAEAQLARHYRLPSFSMALTTDSKICDGQGGYEMGMTMLLCALSGCNSNGPGGEIGADQGTCYEMLVIADEIAGSVYRIIDGINVSEDALAIEIIEKVGIGGQYLAQAHTRENYPKEHFISTLFDSYDWGTWKKHGATDLVTRAREKAQKIIKTHQPEPLHGNIKTELENILKDAEKEILRK